MPNGMTKYKNFIAGSWVAPKTELYFENMNPADTHDIVGRFPESGAEDVAAAVASAKRGFELWRRTPAPARGDVLRRVGDLLVARKEELADVMTREMGKPLAETRGDVQEGIDTAYYAATEGRRLFGHTVPSELRNKWAMSFRRPIGVAGIIAPFNFPLAIPTWKMFPALLCGNACVFKPSEDVPLTGHILVEIMLEAGLPPEVIQLVHGKGNVGAAIVAHPDVALVSFTGSTATGSKVGEACGRTHKRLSLEMGGKNAMIVLDDANLNLALEGILWGAFGTTGQRCTATSRLILQKGIHNEFLTMLETRARALVLGDGRKAGTDVGPLIHERALAKVERYVTIGKSTKGVELRLGGDRGVGPGLDRGYFYHPTIFTGVQAGSVLEQEEIFGPVLSVIQVKDADEAFRVNNDVQYGLSSSVYTQDVNIAFRAMNELDNGITYINAPTIGAEAHMPFGGVKATGNGHREGGWEVYEFYSETKVGYVDFSGSLQRAQIDNY
jgi:acyl-CoA reductase-like NAD-dependent aldehyde dehydrogenase